METTTLTLADDLPATSAPSSIRPRRADEAILPADVWCPIFAYYGGTSSPKFNDSQIEGIARQGTERGWCNLCDAPLVGDRDAHIEAHMRQLRKWRRERGAQIDRERAARAREARKAKAVA